jgi:hypothetical protein
MNNGYIHFFYGANIDILYIAYKSVAILAQVLEGGCMNQASPKYPSTPPGVERVSSQLQSSVLPILPAFPSVHSSTQPGLPGLQVAQNHSHGHSNSRSHLGDILGRSWDPRRANLKRYRGHRHVLNSAHPGPTIGFILERSCNSLGPSWGHLGAVWGPSRDPCRTIVQDVIEDIIPFQILCNQIHLTLHVEELSFPTCDERT